MSGALGRIPTTRKTGNERLLDGQADLGVDLSDFWGWSASDLVSNTQRGVLAEFIVARALGIDTSGVREEWATYDLVTPDGITIEVKSAAYLQSWSQKQLSTISFRTPKTVGWDANTGISSGPSMSSWPDGLQGRNGPQRRGPSLLPRETRRPGRRGRGRLER